jgi:hypothetical protein
MPYKNGKVNMKAYKAPTKKVASPKAAKEPIKKKGAK